MRLTFLLPLLLFAAGVSECRADKRIALVIGNANYQNVGPLNNPRNDAVLIAETLRNVGFELVGNQAQLDLDKTKFDRLIQAFGNALTGADVALFYYSGHGMQIRGQNYLVPISANPVKEADVDFQMVDLALILRQMEGSGTKLNIVILDACRNNPFEIRSQRGTDRGLAQIRAPEGTLLSFATQPGNVALDGTGTNSPYTAALAQTIQNPDLEVFQTFNQVGLIVKRATGGAQQPWVSSSPIDGAFYFARTGTTPAVPKPVLPVPQQALALPPPRSAATQAPLQQRAIAFVTEDMIQSQGTTSDFLDYARQKLDERVDYYGKPTSRIDVLKDKEKYVTSWPARSYRLVMETIRTSCDDDNLRCRINGMVEFSLSNPATGRKSSGTASFDYGLRFGADGVKVFYEQGKIVSKQK